MFHLWSDDVPLLERIVLIGLLLPKLEEVGDKQGRDELMCVKSIYLRRSYPCEHLADSAGDS